MLDSSFPVLKKKIIYLDQFAISEMMKAFNPKTPAFHKIDRFWKVLFCKLDRLLRLQAICCPDSDFHEDESLLWPEYFKDLKMVMSRDMQAWTDSYIIKNQKSNVASDVYYGLTTKALSTNVEDFDDAKGEAVVLVETRRREAMGTTNNASKLFNQEILITFVKENQAWRVDSAYWQD